MHHNINMSLYNRCFISSLNITLTHCSLFSFIFVHFFMWVGGLHCVQIYAEAGGQLSVSSLETLSTCSVQDHSLSGTNQVGQADWPMNPRDPPVSPQCWDYKCAPYLTFYCGFQESTQILVANCLSCLPAHGYFKKYVFLFFDNFVRAHSVF